jgi:NAD(P)-dependent dehydrogenase (short-subunit alcohol dehydrogenase family)
MKRFIGKVAVVTGGGSGIGAATARRLASEGATVVVAGRREEVGEAVAASIREAGGQASFVQADVTVEDDVVRLIRSTISDHGRLDAAFNNAGSTAAGGPIAEIDFDVWRRELDANLTSVFLCLKHQIAAMASGGAIVNNASIAAVGGIPGLAAYTAAKHGVLGLTRAAALECAERRLRVNALVTGNVDTPLYRRLSGVGSQDSLPPAPNPTGRTATPAEIASFVAYLLSDEASFVTGAALAIDGGFTAG